MNQEQVDAIKFSIERNFAVLSRNILGILENLKKNHEINFAKLDNNLPPEFAGVVDMADYFGADHYQWNRKLILDQIGSAKRDLLFLVKDLNGESI